MCKIFLKSALILVVLSYKVDLYPLTNDGVDCDKDWKGMHAALMPEQDVLATVAPATFRLPQFQRILASEVHKDLFKPERNSRPLPSVLKSILLPRAVAKVNPVQTYGPKTIELLCHVDRIYVRVLKSMFTDEEAWKYLSVGTCPVNQASADHYFFLYYINGCDVKREENADRVIYSNTLHYEPVASGPIVWELPFSVPLECRYNKHYRSYQVGFRPEVGVGTMYWTLKAGISLTSVDVTWKPYPSGHSHVIGQPMYFEAKVSRPEEGERLYLNKCFITSSPDPESTPRYVVLDNNGCMSTSSESAQMRFYATNEKTTVRFSLKAFIFKDMISQPKKMMFIHCKMSLAPDTPTSTTKICTYNANTEQWFELYGNDSVCQCCDTKCLTAEPSDEETETITTSDSWEVKEDQPGEDQLEVPGEDQPGEDQLEVPGEDQPGEDQLEVPGDDQFGGDLLGEPGDDQVGEPGDDQFGGDLLGEPGEDQVGEPGEDQVGGDLLGEPGEDQVGEPGEDQFGGDLLGEPGEDQVGEPGEDKPKGDQLGESWQEKPEEDQLGEEDPGLELVLDAMDK